MTSTLFPCPATDAVVSGPLLIGPCMKRARVVCKLYGSCRPWRHPTARRAGAESSSTLVGVTRLRAIRRWRAVRLEGGARGGGYGAPSHQAFAAHHGLAYTRWSRNRLCSAMLTRLAETKLVKAHFGLCIKRTHFMCRLHGLVPNVDHRVSAGARNRSFSSRGP